MSGRGIQCAVILALLLAACESAPPPSQSRSRIDTVAGVVQVTNPSEAPEARLELVLSLGTAGITGDLQPDVFGNVAALVADDAGNIYVADGQAREIRVFDPAGHHLRTIGRSGSGPGEFRYLNSMAWLADTLLVLDPGNARIQRFTTDGSDAGSYRWLPLTGPPDRVRFHPTPDGLIHVPGLPPMAPDGNSLRRGFAFLSMNGGVLVDSLFVPVDTNPQQVTVTCHSPAGISFWSSPLGSRSFAAPAGRGLVLSAQSTHYRISILNAAGDTLRRIIREGADRPVTDAAWQETEDSITAFRGRQPAGASCEPASLSRPAAAPVIAGLYYDHEGRLIVETETGNGFAFDLHDEQGRLLMSFPAPPRNRSVPPYSRAHHLYVATRGEFDVPGAAVFRIVVPNP